METGLVKWFRQDKGYGFISKTDGTDVFVHFTGLAEGEDRRLLPGDRVVFEQTIGEKGPKAVQVRRDPALPDSGPPS